MADDLADQSIEILVSTAMVRDGDSDHGSAVKDRVGGENDAFLLHTSDDLQVERVCRLRRELRRSKPKTNDIE